MKRLLAAGSGSIFEIARVFRADECGPLHNPEFTMLEWYRVGGDYLETMAEVGELVEAVYTAAGRPCLPSQHIATMTYCEAFQAALGVDPLGAPMELLRNLSAARGFIAGDRDNRDDLLNFLLSTAVQPSLPAAAFVCDYPATQAALAKLHPQRDDLALRFELYLHGIEICNGYSELTDADELRARNDRQNAARRAAGKRELPAHSQLLEAMDAGLPECTGVALGIDRLIALALGFESIDQVIALPWDQA